MNISLWVSLNQNLVIVGSLNLALVLGVYFSRFNTVFKANIYQSLVFIISYVVFLGHSVTFDSGYSYSLSMLPAFLAVYSLGILGVLGIALSFLTLSFGVFPEIVSSPNIGIWLSSFLASAMGFYFYKTKGAVGTLGRPLEIKNEYRFSSMTKMFISFSCLSFLYAMSILLYSEFSISTFISIGVLTIFSTLMLVVTIFVQHREKRFVASRKEAKRLKNIFGNVLDHMPTWVYLRESDGRMTLANKSLKLMAGMDENAPLFDLEGQIPEFINKKLDLDILEGRVKPSLSRCKVNTSLGTSDVDITRYLIREKGSLLYSLAVVAHDVSLFVEAEEKVKKQAHTDYLTGMGNKLAFLKIKSRIMNFKEGGVVSISLEGAKKVNENLGMKAGDRLLVELSERLNTLVHKKGHVYRFAGYEFLVWLKETPKNGWVPFLDKTWTELNRAVDIDDHKVGLSAFVGLAKVSDVGSGVDVLLSSADLARRQALEDKGSHYVYTPKMGLMHREKNEIEKSLKEAILNQEIEMFYQPKISLASGETYGFEALARWKHAQRGWISPGVFIPIAEESGLIHDLGLYALEATMESAKAWMDQGKKFGKISVNVSPMQLFYGDFMKILENKVKAQPEVIEHIELELTESALMEDPEEALTQLNRLRTMGFELSMDDFGTGYSGLSILRKYPFQTLKIDMSFVFNMIDSKEDEAIVATIVSLGKSLKMKLVAEGVETEEQASILQSMGCDIGQGFLYSRAVPSSEAHHFLRAI